MIVFTNGCFDLLHAGHVRLLRFAASLGKRLVVGVNDDASVRRLKGPNRPILPAVERAYIVGSIAGVDEVHVFEEDTPERLIDSLRPDVLVKGPECLGTDPPGSAAVRSWGGRLVIPDWPIELSTSRLLGRIRNCNNPPILPRQLALEVNGQDVAQAAEYEIRFVEFADGSRPALYFRGLRVTTAWAVKFHHCQDAEPHGVSG